MLQAPCKRARSRNSATGEANGLVFYGELELDDPNTDWLKVVGDGRDAEILRETTGKAQES